MEWDIINSNFLRGFWGAEHVVQTYWYLILSIDFISDVVAIVFKRMCLFLVVIVLKFSLVSGCGLIVAWLWCGCGVVLVWL